MEEKKKRIYKKSVNVRLDDSDYFRIKNTCEKMQISMPEYFRLSENNFANISNIETLVEQKNETDFESKTLLKDTLNFLAEREKLLRSVSNNLNQIAKVMNSVKYEGDFKILAKWEKSEKELFKQIADMVKGEI